MAGRALTPLSVVVDISDGLVAGKGHLASVGLALAAFERLDARGIVGGLDAI